MIVLDLALQGIRDLAGSMRVRLRSGYNAIVAPQIQPETVVAAHMENNLGHGMEHAVSVTLDAGTLMIIEGKLAGYTDEYTRQRLRLVQSAGLLHDIKRKRKNHAVEGALFARKILEGTTFSHSEVEDICHAIGDHEAFKHRAAATTPAGELVSACLYDADKFRWGPDNFKYTIWDMVSSSDISLGDFVKHYPKGMEGLERIKHTFRTRTGKVFGPQFIEFGIAIGEQLFSIIQTEFTDDV